ncbi:MAG: MFS transporter [Pirellulales bacterium]
MWAVPRLGPVKMQCIGFLGMAAGMCMLVVAVGPSGGAPPNFVAVITGFSIFNLLMNMGPNSTTFSLPPLLFPPEIRGTAAGFSAACAKVGAVTGTLFLPTIKDAVGISGTLALLAALSGTGFLVTATLGRGLLPTTRPGG